MAEAIRPEIAQYFIESDTDGVPFNREQRSIVYQRAKKRAIRFLLGRKKMFMKWAPDVVENRLLEGLK
ncbi:MAG: hypothetical protein V3T45_04440 [Nitrospinaceae bacterium]